MGEMVTIDKPGVSLRLPARLPFEEWVDIGRRLCASSQVINWHVGDWWAFGEARYGERAKAAAAGIFGLAFQSLMNMAAVARAFETSRRREVVSFSHHAEVAALPKDQADELLAKAEREMLSTRDLRKEVSALRSAAATERKRDVIDIRPERAATPAEFVNRDEQIVELANELSLHRPLRERESVWLEAAMARLRRLDERLTEPWTAEHDLHLISLLKEGKRPPDIAPVMERTVGALWRRINKLGGIGRLIGKGPVEEWPIRAQGSGS
jgi:hypothetical protein